MVVTPTPSEFEFSLERTTPQEAADRHLGGGKYGIEARAVETG